MPPIESPIAWARRTDTNRDLLHGDDGGSMKKNVIYQAVIAALLATSSATALAVDEVEPNNQISTAQPLTIGGDGTVTVNGIMGIVSSNPADRFPDLDFYSFDAGPTEVITVDIDGGMKASGVSVDTYLYVFGPDLNIVDWNNQGNPVDEGSLPNGTRTFETKDARIDNLALPGPGKYYIGVSSAPRVLENGGLPAAGTANMVNSLSMGAYTMTLSGLKPQMLAIPIEVKPGNKQISPPVNAKAKGVVPVALLSTPEFDPMTVDQKTLSFGATGDELRSEEHTSELQSQ